MDSIELFKIYLESCPRSIKTNSVTASFTRVNDRNTLTLRLLKEQTGPVTVPYCSVLTGSVIRPYFHVPYTPRYTAVTITLRCSYTARFQDVFDRNLSVFIQFTLKFISIIYLIRL